MPSSDPDEPWVPDDSRWDMIKGEPEVSWDEPDESVMTSAAGRIFRWDSYVTMFLAALLVVPVVAWVVVLAVTWIAHTIAG